MNKPEPTAELALHESPEALTIQPAQMLRAVIDKGITPESVGVVERLVALYERMADKDAERKFAVAFANLQADVPAVQAVKEVPNNDGTVRYCYAPYEEIMFKVRPILQRHGFTVTFSSSVIDGRIVQSCTLQHVGGHKRTNQSAARIGKGPPGSSDAQGDGAASTYAKRFALCDALNIVVERDTDARAESGCISFEQAAYLKEMVKETRSDEKAFLKYAGAADYEHISTDRYDVLARELHKKSQGR